MDSQTAIDLEQYRASIRQTWLPVVGRKKLTSHEYQLIEEWYCEGLPVSLVIQAITNCAGRARSLHITLHSLGVIRADLESLKAQRAKSQVGAQQLRDWLARYTEDLTDLVYLADDETERAAYQALLNELPNLTEAEAHARWREIQQGSGIRDQGPEKR